jgi:membrane fusion protein (multidrug efflux system)
MKQIFHYKRLTTYVLIFATFFIAAAIKTGTIMAKNKGTVLSIPLLKKENGIPVDVIKIARRDFPLEIPMALVKNDKDGYRTFVTPKMNSWIRKGQVFKQAGSNANLEVKTASNTPDVNANLHIVDFALIKGDPGTKGPIKGKLRVDQIREALWVPSSSLKRDNGKTFVFVIIDGIARKKIVETGKENGIGVIITSGLEPDDLVVTRGLAELSDGLKTRIHEYQDSLSTTRQVLHD